LSYTYTRLALFWNWLEEAYTDKHCHTVDKHCHI
jgi:hypothetical protein